MNQKNDDPPKQANKRKQMRGPITILKLAYQGMQKRNAFSKPSFWITNFFLMFICVKATQFFMFIRQFEVQIPKDELINNMTLMNIESLRMMKPDKLTEYLDKLEQDKAARQRRL